MTRSNDPRASAPKKADSLEAESLEQQMADLGLSTADKRFLRTLHQTERQLNEVLDETQAAGDLQQQVSRVYKQLYPPD